MTHDARVLGVEPFNDDATHCSHNTLWRRASPSCGWCIVLLIIPILRSAMSAISALHRLERGAGSSGPT